MYGNAKETGILPCVEQKGCFRYFAEGIEMARKTGSKKSNATFAIDVKSGNTVYVAGTFNGWTPAKCCLKRKDGMYAATLRVPRGRHEYKFIIDEVWCPDPECREWVLNDMGTLNSVITVD